MVKHSLLELLENARGKFLSGEEVAAKLGVSRGAVWKAAEALRREGHPLEAVKNRGYRLPEDSDKLSAAGIRKYLPDGLGVRVEAVASAPSTNDLVRARAEAGEAEGLALFAEEQTAGRGRLRRVFFRRFAQRAFIRHREHGHGFDPGAAFRRTRAPSAAP